MYKGQIICIIIIMFIGVLQFLAVKKGTKLSKPSKWFSILLVMSFFQLIFDIGSVYTVNHLETVSPILNRVVHNFFLGFMQLLFYIVYKYLEAVIEEEIGDRIEKLKYAEVPIILATLGLIFLPLVYIETPVGNYSPDWAIAFYEGAVKHIYFIAETKGSLESLQLKPIEAAKISCAKKLFNELSTGSVRYDYVDSYQSLLDIVMR